jgi:hypothetical protein
MVTYVDALNSWWPAESIAAAMGVPGFGDANPYNVFLYAFWLSTGPADIALVFSKAEVYFTTESKLGKDRKSIQRTIVDAYHAAGKRILVSAFGATEFPTSEG